MNLLLFVDDQEASTAFLSTFEEAATELSKYAVKCSTVDVTKHPKVAGKFGVQAFPTLVSVEGKVTINPYTKQNLRTVKALRERTVKGLKKWALRGKGKRLPHDVQTLTNTSSLDTFVARCQRRGLSGVVLVSGKSKVSNVLKGLSTDTKDRLEIAQVGGDAVGRALATRLGVTMPPAKLPPAAPEVAAAADEEAGAEAASGADEDDEVDLDEDPEEKKQAQAKAKAAAAAKAEANKKKRAQAQARRAALEQEYATALAASTPLPVVLLLGPDGTVQETFPGDASDRAAVYAWMDGHATESPVAALDAAPVKKEYVEVVDVKGHKQLVDDGFREEGLLVLYTRSAKPDTGRYVKECGEGWRGVGRSVGVDQYESV